MSTLSGTKIKDTYSGLLKTTDNAALSGTFKAVTDGAGNNSGLELNTTYARATNGILFGADTAAASALDDYEEGTWTPAASSVGGGESVSYASRSGTYVKIGNTVFLGGEISLSSVSGGSGAFNMTGIPFTPTSSFAGSFFSSNFNVGVGKNITHYTGAALGFLGSDNVGGSFNWGAFSALASNTNITFSFNYKV